MILSVVDLLDGVCIVSIFECVRGGGASDGIVIVVVYVRIRVRVWPSL